jgi:hypothetical protein
MERTSVPVSPLEYSADSLPTKLSANQVCHPIIARTVWTAGGHR